MNGYPFIPILEDAWKSIYDEYLGVQYLLTPWHETALYGTGWRVFGIYGFDGLPMAGVARCPITAELIRTHIPTHGLAGFSVLNPGTRIKPHNGYPGSYLRLHLGLDVPEGDIGLKVGDQNLKWETGKVLLFDDHPEHTAWNMTDKPRVVLLIDFKPPSA